MKRAHSSEQLNTLSLVKSREMLDRISNKVSMIESNRNPSLIQVIMASSSSLFRVRLRRSSRRLIAELRKTLISSCIHPPLCHLLWGRTPKRKTIWIHLGQSWTAPRPLCTITGSVTRSSQWITPIRTLLLKLSRVERVTNCLRSIATHGIIS